MFTMGIGLSNSERIFTVVANRVPIASDNITVSAILCFLFIIFSFLLLARALASALRLLLLAFTDAVDPA